MTPYILYLAALWGIAKFPAKNWLKIALAAIVAIAFVGLRYEVGFDWPDYKDGFETISSVPLSYVFGHLREIQIATQHEGGYVILSAISSRVFGEYEYFQCFVFIVFYASCIYLAKALKSTNAVAAFALAQPFILFSLEFSTIRQSLAIAFFNFGVYAFAESKRARGIVFFALALSMQFSAAIYILVYLLSIGANRRTLLTALGGTLLAIIAVSPAATAIVSGALPTFAAAKLLYYTEDRQYGGSTTEALYSAVLYITVAFFCWKALTYNRGRIEKGQLWSLNFVLISALLAVAFIWLPTVRNRLMYEFIIMFSIVMYSDLKGRLVYARTALFALSMVTLAVSLTQKINFVYIPYQNYVWYMITGQQSDGLSRQDELRHMIK